MELLNQLTRVLELIGNTLIGSLVITLIIFLFYIVISSLIRGIKRLTEYIEIKLGK